MTSTTVTTAERIRALNDAFRRTFVGGAVMITAGVEAMPVEQRRSLLQKVRAFDAFSEDNDPHGEHDFGAVDEGRRPLFLESRLLRPGHRVRLPRSHGPRRHDARADDHARRRILSAQRASRERVSLPNTDKATHAPSRHR